MRYPSDELTAAERARLAPHFTNLDGPVFALVNLPETVKGALFARYSRYPGTLRRLFLDEFADSLPEPAPATTATRASARPSSTSASSSATATTRSRSSAARTSPASGSRTCSRRSSSARGSAPTSSSPRATSPTTRRCPAAATATTATRSSAPSTRRRWTALFDAYADALPRVRAWVDETLPARRRRVARPRAARAVKAKALDLLRGLLPAASLSHMGIYATGQAYEQLILHLLAPPAAGGARTTAA